MVSRVSSDASDIDRDITVEDLMSAPWQVTGLGDDCGNCEWVDPATGWSHSATFEFNLGSFLIELTMGMTRERREAYKSIFEADEGDAWQHEPLPDWFWDCIRNGKDVDELAREPIAHSKGKGQ